MNNSNTELKNILGNDPDELVGVVSELGEKKFRAKQLFRWLSKGVCDFDEMSNLSKTFREKLKEQYCIDIPRVIYDQQSRTDGTRKCLFEFRDGSRVESVFMKYSYGNSICISSQVGCRMGCTFCASTRKGLDRSLTAGEMLAQVLAMRNLTGEDINHVVMMGIGEPFDNYENLKRFLHILHARNGRNLSYRNITVSTSGIIPVIKQFAEDVPQVNLAISLHRLTDEGRSALMPVNRAYPVDRLLEAAGEYAEKTGRRVTFEYTLIKGENDTPRDMELMKKKLRGMLCHVNLIPLNRVEETGLHGSSRKRAEEIAEWLGDNGIAATVRREMGADIDGACGQLRRKVKRDQ